VPVFNERRTLATLLDQLSKTHLQIDSEVIVVDDGSTDGSDRIIRKHGWLRSIHHNRNMGKGAAIRSGIAISSGDFICILDADMEYSPRDLPNLVEPLMRGEAEAVFGSRFLGRPINMSVKNYIGNKILTKLTQIVYKAQITDVMTGYKIFLRRLSEKTPLDIASFGFEIEITARLFATNCRIVEVPISYCARKLGKKITWGDGLMSVYYILKYRFHLKAPRLQFINRLLTFKKKPFSTSSCRQSTVSPCPSSGRHQSLRAEHHYTEAIQ